MTGDETAQYSDRASNVGQNTIDQLREDTSALASKFGNTPRAELFRGVRLLRDRLFMYLEAPSRTGVSPNRDLHFLTGIACGMLARVTDDLGYPAAAVSHVRGALMFAKEAGSTDLTAWLPARRAR